MSIAYDLAAVRADFPILQRPLSTGLPLVYLDSAASAQKPQTVIDVLSQVYAEYYANTHRGIHELGDRVTTAVEEARQIVQQFLRAPRLEEVIFTSGTTASLNLVATGWARKFLKPGDEVVISLLEHHANFVPWQQAALATGATLRFLPLTESGEFDLARVDNVLNERTRIVAFTGLSNVLGTLAPIAELAAKAKQYGAITVLDAAQLVPHGPLDVTTLGVDFVAFSGHKLYGPSGIGVLWGRTELLEKMDPALFGGNMIREVFQQSSTWADLPAKFEAGTLAIAPAIGLGAAIAYLNGVGWEGIRAHERHLLHAAWQALEQIPGVQLYGPPVERRGSLISFTVDGVHPHDLADLLSSRGVAIRAGHHCTMPLHEHLDLTATARASFGLYNTVDDVAALAEAIHFARRTFRLE